MTDWLGLLTLVLDDHVASSGREVDALDLQRASVLGGVRLEQLQHVVGSVVLSGDKSLRHRAEQTRVRHTQRKIKRIVIPYHTHNDKPVVVQIHEGNVGALVGSQSIYKAETVKRNAPNILNAVSFVVKAVVAIYGRPYMPVCTLTPEGGGTYGSADKSQLEVNQNFPTSTIVMRTLETRRDRRSYIPVSRTRV